MWTALKYMYLDDRSVGSHKRQCWLVFWQLVIIKDAADWYVDIYQGHCCLIWGPLPKSSLTDLWTATKDTAHFSVYNYKISNCGLIFRQLPKIFLTDLWKATINIADWSVDSVGWFMKSYQGHYRGPQGLWGTGEKGYLFLGSWGALCNYFRGAG